MINLLWKVHQDSRQFFAHCDKWQSGELLPHSYLDNMVRELIADINISTTITCPVTNFLGTAVATPKREVQEAPYNKPAGGGHGTQATRIHRSRPSVPRLSKNSTGFTRQWTSARSLKNRVFDPGT
jgi:hypothetical protein